MDVSLQSDDHFFMIYQSHHIEITFFDQILALTLQDLTDGPHKTTFKIRFSRLEALRLERQLWFYSFISRTDVREPFSSLHFSNFP